jgi:hypothetical protein
MTYAVMFFCKPGSHWRPCTETVEADNEHQATSKAQDEAIKSNVLFDGPYKVRALIAQQLPML